MFQIRNYLLPPLLLDLKIVSKTSELPLASSLVDWIKILVAPVQDIVETSVLPLGERLMKAVDENLVSNLSEETAGWMAQTKAKLSTIIQHTDDVACQILDAFVLNPVNVQEKEVQKSLELIFPIIQISITRWRKQMELFLTTPSTTLHNSKLSSLELNYSISGLHSWSCCQCLDSSPWLLCLPHSQW